MLLEWKEKAVVLQISRLVNAASLVLHKKMETVCTSGACLLMWLNYTLK